QLAGWSSGNRDSEARCTHGCEAASVRGSGQGYFIPLAACSIRAPTSVRVMPPHLRLPRSTSGKTTISRLAVGGGSPSEPGRCLPFRIDPVDPLVRQAEGSGLDYGTPIGCYPGHRRCRLQLPSKVLSGQLHARPCTNLSATDDDALACGHLLRDAFNELSDEPCQNLVHFSFGEDLDRRGPYVSLGREGENPFRHGIIRCRFDSQDEVARPHCKIGGLYLNAELLPQILCRGSALGRIFNGANSLIRVVAEQNI